jgi:hypothetical protein
MYLLCLVYVNNYVNVVKNWLCVFENQIDVVVDDVVYSGGDYESY